MPRQCKRQVPTPLPTLASSRRQRWLEVAAALVWINGHFADFPGHVNVFLSCHAPKPRPHLCFLLAAGSHLGRCGSCLSRNSCQSWGQEGLPRSIDSRHGHGSCWRVSGNTHWSAVRFLSKLMDMLLHNTGCSRGLLEQTIDKLYTDSTTTHRAAHAPTLQSRVDHEHSRKIMGML